MRGFPHSSAHLVGTTPQGPNGQVVGLEAFSFRDPSGKLPVSFREIDYSFTGILGGGIGRERGWRAVCS